MKKETSSISKYRSVLYQIPEDYRLEFIDGLLGYLIEGKEPSFSHWGLMAAFEAIKNWFPEEVLLEEGYWE